VKVKIITLEAITVGTEINIFYPVCVFGKTAF